ncbi:MAG TPA: DNA alkylation repair protein [Allosphingosinicella sp.]|jgi:3-methyladenine DNA glycosylase AlkC
MIQRANLEGRSGARRRSEVPTAVLAALEAGEVESVNLMEWLAADMGRLAAHVARALPPGQLGSSLARAAREMSSATITQRLRIAGRAIAAACSARGSEFDALRTHKSDLVRQWACYAVNDSCLSLSLDQRLEETLQFAADRNMSVRETAWMAFRPHLVDQFDAVLPRLERLAAHENDNIRRFAVEGTRPRSVWGAHLPILKRQPERGRKLLEQVKSDQSRYVKLAAGNWLNDASRTRADWVIDLCREWSRSDDAHTRFIINRGLRTIVRSGGGGTPRMPLQQEQTQAISAVENGHD